MSKPTSKRANFGLTENTDRDAERQASGAAGSGSGADAVRRRLHALVRLRAGTQGLEQQFLTSLSCAFLPTSPFLEPSKAAANEKLFHVGMVCAFHGNSSDFKPVLLRQPTH